MARSVALESPKKGISSVSSEALRLQRDIVGSVKNYNKLAQLIELSRSNKYAQNACTECFTHILMQGHFKPGKNGSDAQSILAKWLMKKYRLFLSILHSKLSDESRLKLSFDLLKLESSELAPVRNQYYFPAKTFQSLVKGMVSASEEVKNAFLNQIDSYDDLRYYMWTQEDILAEEARESSDSGTTALSEWFLESLLALGFPDDLLAAPQWFFAEPSKSSKLLQPDSHRKAFQDAYISVLRLPLGLDQYKAVLRVLHKQIIPYMTTPELLMDFLTAAYDFGGPVSVLALNSLFRLMQDRNLEYPDFFKKLYGLLNEDLFIVRYRSRFFRLFDLFMTSTHLSASMVASFIKRLSRLSLTAPPSAIVTILPMIYNLLKRHPSCMIMIQGVSEPSENSGKDLYDPQEPDPYNTGALESSLWEIDTLMSHYHPNVSSLARIFKEPFRKPNYVLEDFLDHSYHTLIEAEFKRQPRNSVPTEYEDFDSVMADYVEWSV
ncbi:hypothetical protein CANCADRAFT_141267 [Tortispora caseinolytica NRRL Y-17796]|uniref:CCAAT-binding factor domain-containing protein n=1 Tax=Tortispora caseinolytica NRRL Y-17796 TaxID=767744 RepID=A0A1E4TCV9_9ASCO|nr:hypothetical protein CANCADRAFT_141267 [Tortispora caseinolytica NRRL Y-17796]